jgi:uncharacterized membrane protein YdbT with pleckstrin-like domain
MSYAQSVLQPGENILKSGRLHWTIYLRSILYLIVGAVAVWFVQLYWPNNDTAVLITSAIFALLFLVTFLHAWFLRWITEFAVTDRRVIYKIGFINRKTVEMNMDKVQSVEVEQSIAGRLLGYGDIHVMGTGADEGSVIHMHRIGDPIGLRNAITSR